MRVCRVLPLSWKLWPVPVAHFFQRTQTIGWGSLLRSSCLLLSGVVKAESLGDSVGRFHWVSYPCPNLQGKDEHFCLLLGSGTPNSPLLTWMFIWIWTLNLTLGGVGRLCWKLEVNSHRWICQNKCARGDSNLRVGNWTFSPKSERMLRQFLYLSCIYDIRKACNP